MPRPGDTISLRAWQGQPYRSKQRTLCEAVITRVDWIRIAALGEDDISISLDANPPLDRGARCLFATADGFAGPAEMRAFFEQRHGLPFLGIVIHWSALPNTRMSGH